MIASAREFLRLLAGRPVGLAGLIGVLFFAFLAYVAPHLVPLQDTPNIREIYLTPSLAHPLGTDFRGLDTLNQIVYGGADILTVGFLAAAFSTILAVALGSIAATLGGRVDTIILAITDVALTIPQLILLIVVAAILRPSGFLILAVILALLQWPSLLRQVRAQVLSLRSAITSKPRDRLTSACSTSSSARCCRTCAATSSSISSSR